MFPAAGLSPAAPVIEQVRHVPSIPRATEAVRVEARAQGASMLLRWRVDGTLEFQAVPMTDSDADGQAEAIIPAHADRTIVEFFVDATDASGSATWPAGPVGALWQTDGTFAPAAWTPGAQPVCRAVLRESDRSSLTTSPGGAAFTGSLIIVDGTGTTVRYQCTFRSESAAAPQSFTVEFPPGDPVFGRTALEVNSRFPHSQVLAAVILQRAGLPAGEAIPVQFRLNGLNLAESGARMFGSYARVEPPNAGWAGRQFPLDAGGNLYDVSDDGPGTHGELEYEVPATAANYADTYRKQTNVPAGDYSDLINLTNKLSNAPASSYKAEISQVVNLDQWLTFLAVDSLLGNVKPGLQSGRANDFSLYRGVQDTRFILVPHASDTVLSLGENGTGDPVTRSIFSYEDVTGLNRLMNHPDILPEYYGTLLSLMDTLFNSKMLDPLVDQILAGWTDVATVQQVKNFIAARRASVQSQIPQVNSMTITTPAADVEGMKQTTDGSVNANGTFHVANVRSIMVNGLPALLRYRAAGADAAGSWTCAISAASGVLHRGVNVVTAKLYGGPNGTGNIVQELSDVVFHSGGTGTSVSGILGGGVVQNLFKYGSYSTTPANRVPGSTWKYLADGSNPGPAWKDEGFDDTNATVWTPLATQIGYGDTPRDEESRVTRADSDPNTTGVQSAQAYYFRSTFTIANVNLIASLAGEIRYDDGAAVYVNGVEVLRTPNLPPIAGHNDWADFNGADTTENATAGFSVPLTQVHNGVNTIAVEVHQHDADSLDLTFDLKLDAVPLPSTPAIQWTLAGSPYHLTADTTIPAGVTLTIDPGVSVFADAGRRLIVSGKIKALGTADARLRFSNVPGAPLQDDPREPGTQMVPPKWAGILLTDSLSPENVIRYANFVNAQPAAVEGSITVVRSECLVEHCTFRQTYLHGVYGKNCSLTVQDCHFPDVFPPGKEELGETLDNLSEFVEVDSSPTDAGVAGKPEFFKGFPVGGHLRLYRNVFEGSSGHNDLVDVTAGKWGLTPVFDVQDNIFLGPTGDEHLDLNGDAYIAGNYFQNCTKDIYTSDHGYANAVSGDFTEPETTVVVARNVFTRVDHAVNVKRNVGVIFEHNTMVDINQDYTFTRGTFVQDVKTSAINCFIPDDQGPVPGDGGYAAYNLFFGSVPVGGGAASGFPRVFGWADMDDPTEPQFTTKIEMAHNFLDPAMLDPVIGSEHPDNVFAAVWQPRAGVPLFADRAGKNFAQLPHSPARGTAPFGLDYGATISPGCYLGGLPPATTPNAVTNVTVGGPGIFAYQWRLDGGAWSVPVPIAQGVFPRAEATVRTALLTTPALADGLHTLEVIGQDFAGNWQAVPTIAAWTVQSGLQRLEISEVLADNLAAADTVELHNAGAAAISLSGWFLSDDASVPQKFPLSGSIAAGAWLTLSISGLDLDAAGDDLHLFQGATTAGSVSFGAQITHLSIGKIGRGGDWTLCTPTPNAANAAVKTGPVDTLRFNEWLAAPGVRFSAGWVEIANSGLLPVALAGISLTNNPAGNPQAFVFPPLSFIAANGYLRLTADNSTTAGHMPFTLDPQQGGLLLTDTGTVLDAVSYAAQTADISMGLDQDDGGLMFFPRPTGGYFNSLGEPLSYRPWLAWTATTDGADADADGMDAFTEFALRSDPHTADVLQPAGTASQITVLLPHLANPQGHGMPEVTYVVQAANDLSSPSWTALATKRPDLAWTGPGEVTVGSSTNGFVPVTVQDTPAVPGRPRRFLRMILTWTP